MVGMTTSGAWRTGRSTAVSLTMVDARSQRTTNGRVVEMPETILWIGSWMVVGLAYAYTWIMKALELVIS